MSTDRNGQPDDIEEIVCRDLVELVTDYLEQALEPRRHALVEEHLVICAGCRDYLGEMERASHALRSEPGESLPEDRRRALAEAFRTRSGEAPR